MPTIRVPQLKKEIQVASGTPLMKALLAADIPVASSCGGDGVCGKCRLEIVIGANHLSPPNTEEDFLKQKLKIEKNFRISCLTQVLGDIEVRASYW